MIEEITSLMHIKEVIDALKALRDNALNEAEREAVQDSLQQAYARAAFLLERHLATMPVNVRWYYLCRSCRHMKDVTFE